MNRRKLLTAGMASLPVLAMQSFTASAQTGYPTRPIKLIVPFAPGGVVDVIGRMWAEKVRASLGTVVIENKGGAGGLIGAEETVHAQPDGYTILLGNTTTQVLIPAIRTPLPYDVLKEFVSVSVICTSATSIVINPSVPAQSLQELIAYAKSNPTRLSYGSAGAGTMTNLAGEIFKMLAGTPDITHVAYKGVGPGMADLISGHVNMMTPNITAQLLSLHRAGKVRILTVNTPTRLKVAPDIPTSAEAGLPEMIVRVFHGLFAPIKTPKVVVDKIVKATHLALADEVFQKKLIESGFEVAADSSSTAAAQLVSEEYMRLTPLIRAVGFMLN